MLEVSCDQPEDLLRRGGDGAGAPRSSYSVLLRVGFTQPAGHPAAGALLPHRFTLTRRSERSVSVALSVASPRLGVTQHPARWSSDFPLPFERKRAAARPPGWGILLPMVGFTADAYPDIIAGRKTVTWRLWKYAHVKAGKLRALLVTGSARLTPGKPRLRFPSRLRYRLADISSIVSVSFISRTIISSSCVVITLFHRA